MLKYFEVPGNINMLLSYAWVRHLFMCHTQTMYREFQVFCMGEVLLFTQILLVMFVFLPLLWWLCSFLEFHLPVLLPLLQWWHIWQNNLLVSVSSDALKQEAVVCEQLGTWGMYDIWKILMYEILRRGLRSVSCGISLLTFAWVLCWSRTI